MLDVFIAFSVRQLYAVGCRRRWKAKDLLQNEICDCRFMIFVDGKCLFQNDRYIFESKPLEMLVKIDLMPKEKKTFRIRFSIVFFFWRFAISQNVWNCFQWIMIWTNLNSIELNKLMAEGWRIFLMFTIDLSGKWLKWICCRLNLSRRYRVLRYGESSSPDDMSNKRLQISLFPDIKFRFPIKIKRYNNQSIMLRIIHF